MENINGGTTRRLDPRTGFDGEVALGHYFAPIFAIELGAGYFESKGSPSTPPGETRLRVVPVRHRQASSPAGTGRAVWRIWNRGLFHEIEGGGDVYNFNTSTKITYGLHAGINFNVTDNFFLGVEERYLWVEPSFGVRMSSWTVLRQQEISVSASE